MARSSQAKIQSIYGMDDCNRPGHTRMAGRRRGISTTKRGMGKCMPGGYRCLAASALGGWLLGFSALATENGGSNYLPGFYGDMGMAVLPAPGAYFYNFFAAYRDRADNGGTVLEMPGADYISETFFLGGRYFAGLFPAISGAWGQGGSRFGTGDAYLLPGGLSWQLGNLTATLFEGIVAPTGYYSKDEVSPGRNIWTFDHNLMLTLALPRDLELSVDLGYMNNLENPATRYRSGDEIHFDYTLSHYLKPDLAIGAAGSYYAQITPDQAPGNLAAIPFSTAASIGPVLMFMPRIGGRDVTMSLKWLHEYHVVGRPADDYLIMRTLVAF